MTRAQRSMLILSGLLVFGGIETLLGELGASVNPEFPTSSKVFSLLGTLFGAAFLYLSVDLPRLVASKSPLPRTVLWLSLGASVAFCIDVIAVGGPVAAAVVAAAVRTLVVFYMVSTIYRLQLDAGPPVTGN